jgi:hypothetical protein
MLQAPEHGKSPRLDSATSGVAHARMFQESVPVMSLTGPAKKLCTRFKITGAP